MAQTIAIDQSHRTSPRHAHIGLVRVSDVITDVYATATGGVTVDISTQLALLSIAFADVIAVVGLATLTGHTPSFTRTAVNGQFTMRLWDGATEIAEGALTQTVTFLVFYNPGPAA